MNVATATRHAISLFLFWTLIGVYGLSYNGVPVTDDEQLFASAALSLAVNGELRAPQLYGNQRLQGIYRGVGPLHPAIGALALRINPFRAAGSVQLLFLLPPLYTTLTGMLIFRLALQLGYPVRSGVLAALFFGLSTMAWPYSKTFFRETLAMLLLMAAWLCFEITMGNHASGLSRLAGFAGFCLAFAGLMLTKIQAGVALPAFAWVGWRKLQPNVKSMGLAKHLWAAGALVFLFSALAAKYILDQILPADIHGRLSLSFLEFAWRRLWSTPHMGFWNATLGATFSSGKGFFWYSPVTILAISSILPAGKRHKREVQLPWLIFLGLLVTQALAYDQNWWSITWGTRFLLPVLPLMVVAVLPSLDHFLCSNRPFIRLIPWALFTVGVLIQLSAVLISDTTYLARLYQKIGPVYPDPMLWGLRYMPVVGHYGMLLDGADWDLVSWRAFEQQPSVTFIVMFLSAGIFCTGLLGLFRSLLGKSLKLPATAAVILAGLAFMILGGLLLQVARSDPSYYAAREDFKKAHEWMAKNARPGDAIVVNAYLEPVWYYLWNFGQTGLPVYSLPDRDSRARTEWTASPGEPSVARLSRTLSEQQARLWLVCERPCPAGDVEQLRAGASLRSLDDRHFRDPQSGLQTEVILFEIH